MPYSIINDDDTEIEKTSCPRAESLSKRADKFPPNFTVVTLENLATARDSMTRWCQFFHFDCM